MHPRPTWHSELTGRREATQERVPETSAIGTAAPARVLAWPVEEAPCSPRAPPPLSSAPCPHPPSQELAPPCPPAPPVSPSSIPAQKGCPISAWGPQSSLGLWPLCSPRLCFLSAEPLPCSSPASDGHQGGVSLTGLCHGSPRWGDLGVPALAFRALCCTPRAERDIPLLRSLGGPFPPTSPPPLLATRPQDLPCFPLHPLLTLSRGHLSRSALLLPPQRPLLSPPQDLCTTCFRCLECTDCYRCSHLASQTSVEIHRRPWGPRGGGIRRQGLWG